MRQKKGQFFILAAIIISAVIISLSVTSNYVRVNREPQNFYDFTYEIKKEAGGVLDYQIYSNFSSDANLTEFIDLVAKDARDKDPDSNLIFIYGDNETLYVRNYAGYSVGASSSAGSVNIQGGNKPIVSSINFLGANNQVVSTYDTSKKDFVQEIQNPGKTVSIGISGGDYTFPISEHKQVILINQKSTGNETHVEIK